MKHAFAALHHRVADGALSVKRGIAHGARTRRLRTLARVREQRARWQGAAWLWGRADGGSRK